MGTRSGDMDPVVLTYLLNLGELTAEGIDAFLNKKSGYISESFHKMFGNVIFDRRFKCLV